MKNFFIKLFGGVTPQEFAETFSLAAKDREFMVAQVEFYQSQCKVKDDKIAYLQDLIFKKTGFLATSDPAPAEIKNFKPISGHQSWQSVKANLIHKDRIEFEKRNKHAN